MVKFFLDLYQIRPTQLYLDEAKVKRMELSFEPLNIRNNMPLPVKKIGGEVFLMDGHVRAYLYDKAHISLIPVYWDERIVSESLLNRKIDWCTKEKIIFINDLKKRMLPPDQFKRLWLDRCLQEEEQINQSGRTNK